MNAFWSTILATLLGAVSFVGAKFTANWIADNTYRANRTQPSVVQMVQPGYQRAFERVKVPNYFRRSTPRRPPRRYRMRH